MSLALALVLLAAETDPRPTASVLDPRVGGLEPEEADVLRDAIRDAVVRAGRFRVQDRGAMREILAQQELNQSEACDESCVVEQGRILQVRYLFSATARRAEGMTWLTVRMTDVATGAVAGIARGSCRCGMEEMLATAEGLVREVLGVPEAAPPPPPVVIAPPAPPEPPADGHTWTVALAGGVALPAAGFAGGVVEAGVNGFALQAGLGWAFGTSYALAVRVGAGADGSGNYVTVGGGFISDQAKPTIWALFGHRMQWDRVFMQFGLGGCWIKDLDPFNAMFAWDWQVGYVWEL